MNINGWVWELVGWAALLIVAALVVIFLYRRLAPEFPLFFLYLLATELVGIVRFAASGASPHVYHNVYWITDIGYTLFALTATYELFIKRLFPDFYKVTFYRYIFVAAVILITILAIVIGLIGGHARVLVLTVYVYNFIRVAILFFFVALMLVMGRQWNKQEFGIAVGFGLDVSMSLAALGVWFHTPSMAVIINRTSGVVYDVVCLIWVYCFWSARRTTISAASTALSAETLGEAKKWESSLKDFISPNKR
jgi:hypothetical protein